MKLHSTVLTRGFPVYRVLSTYEIFRHNGTKMKKKKKNIKWIQRNSPLLPTEIQFPDPQEARRPRWPALHTHILCADTICSIPSRIIIFSIYSTGRDVPLKLRLYNETTHMNPTDVTVLWRGQHIAGDYLSWTERERMSLVAENVVADHKSSLENY